MHTDTRRILRDFLEDIRVEKMLTSRLRPYGNAIYFDERQEIRFEGVEEVFIAAVGKAACAMAHAFLPILKRAFHGRIKGYIITKDGHAMDCAPLEVHEVSHPIPDRRSVEATEKLVTHLVENRGQSVHVIALVSGGASSLLVAPATGITLEDKIKANDVLLKSGADIREINAIRKHISKVKGGLLAQMVAPLPLTTLILSDVVGDDLGSIGSGPTVADETTFDYCLKIIKRYEMVLPTNVMKYLEDGRAGRHPETPKPGTLSPKNITLVVGNLDVALRSLRTHFERLGYSVIFVEQPLTGLNTDVVGFHVQRLVSLKKDRMLTGLCCMLSGGESTVKVKGSGKGGRNTEFALELGVRLFEEGFRHFEVVSLGTDGTDGPTDAAGGLVTDTMLLDSTKEAWASLKNNDSYNFLLKHGGLLTTGPTGTNVNDVHFVILR